VGFANYTGLRGSARPSAAYALANKKFSSSKVEGIEEHVAAFALATKPLEHRESILVAGHGLVVDQTRADLP